jgi:hypothetical protein
MDSFLGFVYGFCAGIVRYFGAHLACPSLFVWWAMRIKRINIFAPVELGAFDSRQRRIALRGKG